jgi:hypothetical protein
MVLHCCTWVIHHFPNLDFFIAAIILSTEDQESLQIAELYLPTLLYQSRVKVQSRYLLTLTLKENERVLKLKFPYASTSQRKTETFEASNGNHATIQGMYEAFGTGASTGTGGGAATGLTTLSTNGGSGLTTPLSMLGLSACASPSWLTVDDFNGNGGSIINSNGTNTGGSSTVWSSFGENQKSRCSSTNSSVSATNNSNSGTASSSSNLSGNRYLQQEGYRMSRNTSLADLLQLLEYGISHPASPLSDDNYNNKKALWEQPQEAAVPVSRTASPAHAPFTGNSTSTSTSSSNNINTNST